MDIHGPLTSTSLTSTSKNSLKTGGFTTFADLLVLPISEVARRCKISAQEAKNIYEALLRQCKPISLPTLDDAELVVEDIFSTGDHDLDQALGGGIRTGMLWEIVGESAAGKSQLALQLSLLVQNPPTLGGLSGSCCYLTTSSKLPTTRLRQLISSHPQISKSHCSLSNVHTISTTTLPILTNILTSLLPTFIHQKKPSSHPVKLVIIDALAELFHSSDKTNKTTLFERAKELTRLGSTLHSLLRTHNIAIVVINEVIDRFDRGTFTNRDPALPPDLLYSEQSRFFGTCSSVPGENGKEASLGLVWANQVNARIMLSRTGRRRYLDQTDLQKLKKAKLSDPGSSDHISNDSYDDPRAEDQSTLIRRLSVIFNTAAPSVSLDYIVITQGVQILPDDHTASRSDPKTFEYRFVQDEATSTDTRPSASQQHPQAERAPQPNPSPTSDGPEADKWDQYWADDDLSKGWNDADWDNLERTLTQTG
ncbi:P-loop containing nucleoside triphosphate hydrolase protein [Coprinopsis marcescibilis]|uniref:P-loop containing nucleoside triphosphate hydrolase protein n=1 Tax=Coprinopsis marcescibilis TaxID=230819 RepID=A0A5C3L2F3_COPMA|nr:P-loop containing nucleoside triphosphate hydrolase protein [Coprinopsis marcescibilis]